MSGKYDVVSYMDACVDIIADIGDGYPEFGQKERTVNSIEVMLGGSACIFLSQCAKLGLNAAGPGVLGKDHFGGIIKRELEQNGVDVSLIIESGSARTSSGVILCRGLDRSILTDSRSIKALRAEDMPASAVSGARHLHISSYYLLTGLKDEIPGILNTAKGNGLTTSLDTNWDPAEEWDLPDEVLDSIDIIMPNENEALLLSGEESLDKAAECFLKRVPTVVIKTGPEGARLYCGGESYIKKPPDFPVTDTVGAGDSFDAGFIYGFLNGLTPERSLDCALYCGSMNVRKTGGCAGQPYLDQLLEYLRTV